jgi:histidinol dehydrogenase
VPARLDATSLEFEMQLGALLARRRETQTDVAGSVAPIVESVRRHGDAALLDYTRKFDGADLTDDRLRLTQAEIDAAAGRCSATVVGAIEAAAVRIRDYHQRLMPADLDYTDAAGVRLGARWRPLAAVGVYVPGGTAAYPSSVLMNAIPARVAGVDRIAMCVPMPNGEANPAVMAAAKTAGIGEVYRIGGAQAIAALAYGTATVPAVDKIVGPGNAYVAAAKRQVFGDVGIDLIAGPSEVLIIADRKNDPSWIAIDLLSQAEHDGAAQAILITDDAAFAVAVEAAIDGYLRMLPRRAVASQSWSNHGAIICVRRLVDAVAIANRVAPEHLELAIEDPRSLLDGIRHAGAIFLGRYAPEAVGDYIAGPNHVLPTGRSARFASGLGVQDFLKRTSLIACDASSLAALAPSIVTLARAEGLDAHAESVLVRARAALSE